MKDYQKESEHHLDINQFTIIRLEHQSLPVIKNSISKPYKKDISLELNKLFIFLGNLLQNCKFGYLNPYQNEIILVFDNTNESSNFNITFSDVQKLSSHIASMCTLQMNNLLQRTSIRQEIFEAQAFNIPTKEEVAQYISEKQLAAKRKSIEKFAKGKLENSQIENLSTDQIIDKLLDLGHDWTALNSFEKWGFFAKFIHTDPVPEFQSDWISPLLQDNFDYFYKSINDNDL